MDASIFNDHGDLDPVLFSEALVASEYLSGSISALCVPTIEGGASFIGPCSGRVFIRVYFQLICANNRRGPETILKNSTYYLPEVQNYHAAEFLQQKYGENSTSYGND